MSAMSAAAAAAIAPRAADAAAAGAFDEGALRAARKCCHTLLGAERALHAELAALRHAHQQQNAMHQQQDAMHTTHRERMAAVAADLQRQLTDAWAEIQRLRCLLYTSPSPRD